MGDSKHRLNKFLIKNKRTPEKEYTHTAIPHFPIAYGGSYHISSDTYNQFLDVYHDFVFRDGNTAYLTEAHINYSPILIDIDLRHSTDITSRQYTEQFIIDFLDIYIEKVHQLLDINEDTPLPIATPNPTLPNTALPIPFIIFDPKLAFGAT